LLGLRRPAEEQVQEVLEDRDRAWCRGQHLRLHLGIAHARPRAQQHQLAHQLGVAPGQVQRLEAAEREPQHVDLFQAQRANEGSCVVGHVLDAGARLATGRGNAAAVVENDFTAFGRSRITSPGRPVPWA
jgi:hypothetical protein